MIHAVTALDLGNYGTRAACVGTQGSSVLPASNGKTWIATAIARKYNDWVVGEDAANFVCDNPDKGVIGLKQLLRAGSDTALIDGTEYKVSALIGEFICRAFPDIVALTQGAPMVVTYPTDTGQDVRQATINAIRESGVNLLPIRGGIKPLTCDEALALAIASVQEAPFKIKEGDLIYCADHGHVTGDHTMMVANKVNGSEQIELRTIAWRGSPFMGGYAIDDAIVDYVRTINANVDDNPHAAQMAARMVKTLMSDPNIREARFMLLVGYAKNKPQYWEAMVDRTLFDKLVQPFREALNATVEEIIEQTGTPTAVIVGGGLANLPYVSRFLGEATGCKHVHVVDHPEIATVEGAALYGAMAYLLKPDAIAVQPTVRRDIVINVTDEDQMVVIPAGTPIPTKPVELSFERTVNVIRIAEGSSSDTVSTTSTPYYVNMDDGKRRVLVSADFTGICLQRGTPRGKLTTEDVDWSSRREVETFMSYATAVATTLARGR